MVMRLPALSVARQKVMHTSWAVKQQKIYLEIIANSRKERHHHRVTLYAQQSI